MVSWFLNACACECYSLQELLNGWQEGLFTGSRFKMYNYIDVIFAPSRVTRAVTYLGISPPPPKYYLFLWRVFRISLNRFIIAFVIYFRFLRGLFGDTPYVCRKVSLDFQFNIQINCACVLLFHHLLLGLTPKCARC